MPFMPQRLHSNGHTANVRQTQDGRFVASASDKRPDGVVDSEPLRTDIETIDEARKVADKLAHPDCTDDCPSWSSQ